MRLVGYCASGTSVVDDTLRQFLRERLPEYMIPALFVMLDRLPATANGKIDRRALPEPVCSARQRLYVAPRSTAEREIALIFSEILGIDRIGVDDNFFDLGGHSLLAMQVVSRLRREFAVDVPLYLIFEKNTVAGMAAEIEYRQGGEGLAGLLARVEKLSDDEIERLLVQDS